MNSLSKIISFGIILISTFSVFAQQAPATPAGGGGGLMSVLPMMLIMFVIIYFFMIRPEQKKQKERNELLKNIKKGDKVLTAGGIIGVVGNIKDNSVMVRIADNTTVEFTKSAVTTVIKGDEVAGEKPAEKAIENKEEKKK